MLDILCAEWYVNCDTSNTDLECLKIFVRFHFLCNEMMSCINLFSDSISQGSVATRLRCGGIFTDNDRFIANFLENAKVTEFQKIGHYLIKLCLKLVKYCSVGRLLWTRCKRLWLTFSSHAVH